MQYSPLILLVLALASFLIAGCAATLSIQQKSADQLSGNCSGIAGRVLQYGVAKGDFKELVKAPGGTTPAGMHWIIDNIRLVQTTNRIPLAHGNLILQDYEISGLPLDQPLAFKRVTEFPPMTGADGRIWTKSERVEWLQTNTGTFTYRYYWFFDADRAAFEMVEGTWVFRYLHGNCVMFEQRFEAYKP